jgi:ribulose-5-phosphate 4-epimerase/fuculose-1-phosphate aldolase
MKRSAPAKAAATPAAAKLIEDLVAANRILAEHGVVDGYGHVSVRHERDPHRYLLSRSLAPALVTAGDVKGYDLDSNPLDDAGHAMYLERFIHGEIYRVRPDVRAVVHHHSPSVIPFAATTVSLRPLYHMSAFIGEGVPVFEIRDAGGMTDMLIRDAALGRALARTLGHHPAALMRGHGAVVVGADLPLAVARSVYLELNARLQVQTIALGGNVTYLDPEEVEKVVAVLDYARAWELWKRKTMAR